MNFLNGSPKRYASKYKYAIFFVVISIWVTPGSSQVHYQWSGDVSRDWSDPANWNPSGVPGEIDTVSIYSGNPVMNAGTKTYIAKLDFRNGSLTVNDSLFISDSASWKGGTFFGTGTIINTTESIFEISENGRREFYQLHLLNLGTLLWADSSSWVLSNGALIENYGLIEFRNHSDVSRGSSSFPLIRNQPSGIIRKLKSGSRTTITGAVVLENDGLIEVEEGTLELFSRGVFTGEVRILNRSVLRVGNEVQSWGSTSSIVTNGRLEFYAIASYQIDFSGTLDVLEATVVNGPNLILLSSSNSFGDSLIIENGKFEIVSDTLQQAILELRGGILTGEGSVFVDSAFIWTGGRIEGTGFLELGTNASSHLNTSSILSYRERTLVNKGSLSFNGGGSVSFAGYPTTVMKNSGEINFPDSFAFTGSLMLTNDSTGKILKDGTDGEVSFGLAITIENNGMIDHRSGRLLFICNGVYKGTFRSQPSTIVEFGGGLHTFADSSRLDLAGQLVVSGGSRLSFGMDITLPSGTLVEYGDIGGLGEIQLSDTLVWKKGTMRDTSTFIINPQGYLQIKDSTGFILWERRLLNKGTILLDNSQFTVTSNARVENEGLFRHVNTGRILGSSFGISGTFPEFMNLASGTFIAENTDSLTTYPAFNFNNYGSVMLVNAIFDFRGSISNGYFVQHAGSLLLDRSTIISSTDIMIRGGEVLGSGTIEANLYNNAVVNPGRDSANFGIIFIEGSYVQDSTATLVIDAHGKSPGTGYDQLTVNSAVLDGMLDMRFQFDSTFNPFYNSRFRVVRWLDNTYEGNFDTITHTSYYTLNEFMVWDTIEALAPVYTVNDLTLYGLNTKREFWFQLDGKDKVRPGQSSLITMYYGNRTQDTLLIPLLLTFNNNTTLISRVQHFPDYIPWEDPVDENYYTNEVPFRFPDTSYIDGTSDYPIVLMVPPGSSRSTDADHQGSIKFSVTPACGGLGARVSAKSGAPVDEDLENCLYGLGSELIGFLPGGACVQGAANIALSGFQEYNNESDEPFSAGDFIASAGWDVAKCAVSFIPGATLVTKTVDILDGIMSGLSTAGTVSACGNVLLPKPYGKQANKDVSCVYSKDPNEKSGPAGSGVEKYITGDHPVVYSIYFENTDTATAPAQTVYITDQLNPVHWDLSTFGFLPISIGDTIVSVPSAPFTIDADLRDRVGVIVRIKGDIDLKSGLIQWSFTSLDTITGEPVTDALAGFLPPNVNDPEGQGSVSYILEPNQDLSEGTSIGSDAAIIFDSNPAIRTNEWINRIDRTAPTSKLVPFEITLKDSLIALQWSGSDAGSGIQSYILYASKNEGPFTEVAAVHGTGFAFEAETCASYRFYTIAVDSAGNIELPKFSEVRVEVNPYVDFELEVDGNRNFCFGDSILLKAPSDSTVTYSWYMNGELLQGMSDSLLYVSNTGNYSAFLQSNDICSGTSGTIEAEQHGLPEISISPDQSVLTVSDDFITYQWYLNGSVIDSANSNSYVADEEGSYHVTVLDSFGCVGVSEAIDYAMDHVDGLGDRYVAIYPNPGMDGKVFVNLYLTGLNVCELEILDHAGRKLVQNRYQEIEPGQVLEIDVSELSPGNYIIHISAATFDWSYTWVKL